MNLGYLVYVLHKDVADRVKPGVGFHVPGAKRPCYSIFGVAPVSVTGLLKYFFVRGTPIRLRSLMVANLPMFEHNSNESRKRLYNQ